MFINKLELSKQEVLQKEEEFRSLVLDPSWADATFEELGDFFADRSLDESVSKYGMTYWRWYVWLTWNRLNILDKEDIVTVFATQVPTAVTLDFDILKSLMSYFVANNYIENDIEPLYLKISTAFQDSQAVVGLWQGKEVRVVDLIKEIRLITIRNNSLEQANFETKLHQIMFPANSLVQAYESVNFGVAVQRFIDLCIFFDRLDGGNIWLAVNNFLSSIGSSKVVGEKLLEEDGAESDSAVAAEEKLANEQVIDPGSDSEINEENLVEKLTPQQIKSQIESEFKKDTEGNFEDIDAVMRKLEEFTEMYNDPKIADLIYFDEEEGRFKWKI